MRVDQVRPRNRAGTRASIRSPSAFAGRTPVYDDAQSSMKKFPKHDIFLVFVPVKVYTGGAHAAKESCGIYEVGRMEKENQMGDKKPAPKGGDKKPAPKAGDKKSGCGCGCGKSKG